MTGKDLIKAVSGTLSKQDAMRFAMKVYPSELLRLSFHEKSEIAFRASWILEYVVQKKPFDFIQSFDEFIEVYPAQKNPSCQRHFTKILMRNWTIRSLDNYPDEKVEPLVSATFEWLIDPATPVAVQVNCIDILFKFTSRYDWIGEELKQQIEFLLKDGSAAMQSRGRKVLSKL